MYPRLSLNELEINSILRPIYHRGHKILRALLILYFLIGTIFSYFQPAWEFSFLVQLCLIFLFLFLSVFQSTSFLTRALGGVFLQIFSFFLAYQFDIKYSSEVFFFLSFIALVLYLDWKVFIPSTLVYLIGYCYFTFLNPIFVDLNQLPLYELVFISFMHMWFGLIEVILCSYLAFIFRNTTLRDHEVMKLMDKYSQNITSTYIFLNKILDNIPYMISVQDIQNQKIIISNKFFEEQKKQNFSIEAKLDHEIEVENIKTSSQILQNEKGEYLYLETKQIPILENEQVKYLLEISADITQKIKKEEELQEAKKQAERLNKVKSEFLANMSHELRTPLNSIIGFGQFLLMESEGKLNFKQREYVKYILKSGELLLGIINEILDLSKIEAGKFELNFTPSFLKPILESSLKTLEPLALKKNIQIGFNFPEQDIVLNLDPLRFQQIILNLLNNAIKFTDAGKQVGIDVNCNEDFLSITIWDEGVGIEESNIPIIFEPFEQIQGKSKNLGGTGLGLSIAKKLIEKHGGTIEVKSQLGKGSQFIIKFTNFICQSPKENLKESNSFLQEKQKTMFKKSYNFLVLEDDELSAQILQTALSLQNQNCFIAENWLEAKEILETEKIDLLLTDIHLPDALGTDIVKWVKLHFSDIPVIAVSASTDSNLIQNFIEIGFKDFIEKPVSIQKLYEKIQKILN